MKREGWESELAVLVEHYVSNPVEFGCLMAADWVGRVTDYKPPRYLVSVKTIRAALKSLKRYGGGNVLSVADKIADEIGAVQIPVKRTQRGDVMAFEGDAPFDAALGVCVGKDCIVSFEGRTLLVPKVAAFKAWRL